MHNNYTLSGEGGAVFTCGDDRGGGGDGDRGGGRIPSLILILLLILLRAQKGLVARSRLAAGQPQEEHILPEAVADILLEAVADILPEAVADILLVVVVGTQLAVVVVVGTQLAVVVVVGRLLVGEEGCILELRRNQGILEEQLEQSVVVHSPLLASLR